MKTILSRSVENLPSTAGTIDARYVQSVPHADVSHAEVSCSSAMLWKRLGHVYEVVASHREWFASACFRRRVAASMLLLVSNEDVEV